MAMPPILTGQVSVGAAIQPLSASVTETVGYTIKAPLSNSQPVYLGNSSVSPTTGYQLDPGDELAYERLNQAGQPVYKYEVSDWYVVGTTGDKITWLASV